MNVFSGKTIFLCFFFILFFSFNSKSQDEYRAEIGLQGGANIYTGDVNTVAKPDYFLQNMKNIQPDFGLFFRYRFNPRTALRLGYDYSTVNGSYTYNVNTSQQLSQTLHIVDMTGEYNFFDLENDPYKRYSKKYSPYIFAGLGVIYIPDAETLFQKKYAPTIPFGIGLKWKMAKRWNLNVQWTNQLLLSDNLEGTIRLDYGELIKDWDLNGNPVWPNDLSPIPTWTKRINPMNNDLLSGLTVGISFDFWKKGCDCNQSDKMKKKTSVFQR